MVIGRHPLNQQDNLEAIRAGFHPLAAGELP